MFDLKPGMFVKIYIPGHQINLREESALPAVVLQRKPVKVTEVYRQGYHFQGTDYPLSFRTDTHPNWHYWGNWNQIVRDNECLLREDQELQN